MDLSDEVRDAEARALKALWERRKDGRTQGAFGAEYGIGSPGMVWQYLHGHRPLNVDAATKFALGLNAKIADFSPRLAELAQASARVAVEEPAGSYRVDAPESIEAWLRLMTPEDRAFTIDFIRAAVKRFPSGYSAEKLREILSALDDMEAFLAREPRPPEQAGKPKRRGGAKPSKKSR